MTNPLLENKLAYTAGINFVRIGKWLAYKSARRSTVRGRKPFRRANKAKSARKAFQPVERFHPDLTPVTIPDKFQPHQGADPTGNWQLDFLRDHGLKADHSFLDVGCGDLRAGLPLMRYLDVGRYSGLDQAEIAILQGCVSMTPEDWAREPRFFVGGDFGFEQIQGEFEWLWCHSVFTHVDLSQVGKCLASARSVLAPDGQLIATVFTANRGSSWVKSQPYRRESASGEKSTYAYRNPYHHSLAMLEALATELHYQMDVMETDHPKGQVPIRFKPI